MADENYTVYVKTDPDSVIIAINSSAFLTGIDGWAQIDEGSGDRYHHAQGNYLEKGLIDERGCYNYKFAAGMATERTAAEKQADIDNRPPAPPTDADRLSATEAAILALMEVLSNV